LNMVEISDSSCWVWRMVDFVLNTKTQMSRSKSVLVEIRIKCLGFEKIFKTSRVLKKAGQFYLQLLVQNIETILN